MVFDRAQPEQHAGKDEYPSGAPERFASALQQFVWSCRPPTGADAWDGDDACITSSPAAAEGVCLAPPPSRHTVHTLRALRDVLDAARFDMCDSRTDPATEAGLYLMRLTRLLEQHTLTRVQSEMAHSLHGSASLLCVSPPSPACSTSFEDSGVSCADRGGSPRGSSTVHSRGRRYTRPETASSSSPSPSGVFDPRSDAAESKGAPLMWRFHADLTLHLQQCMLRSMCFLDTALADLFADDSGMCGILTHSKAAQLQGVFIDSIRQALHGVQDKWEADPNATEAIKEVAVALERLHQAALAQQQHGGTSPQLHVYELSTSEATRRSPPPFTSRKRSPSLVLGFRDVGSDDEASDSTAAPGSHSDIERCLGVAGCDYASKLVAQQLWCAQKTLSQRFPTYGATWDRLERARFFVESTRSPTPTVPRSDSDERHHSTTLLGTSASAAPPNASSPERAFQHDGGTPPPCVTTTQRKSERPYSAVNPKSPPFRSLTYSEERSADVEETEKDATATTMSPSRRPTVSPPARHGAAVVPRLLPAVRCALWDSFLEDCGVPPASTLIAIQQLAGEVDTLQRRKPPPLEPSDVECRARFLQKVPLNQSREQKAPQRRKKTYSIETEHGLENTGSALATKRTHARSS